MSLPRPSDNQSTTGKIHFKILSLENAEKDAEKMQKALLQLGVKVADADVEYTLYLDQKEHVEENYPESVQKKSISLFAKDFADFKEKLNQAIREFNQFHQDYRFQLAILAKSPNSSYMEQVQEIEKSLNQLKAYYNRDKALYVGVELPKHNPDIVRFPTTTSSDANNEPNPAPSGLRK